MPAFVQQVANTADTSTTLTLTLPANATAGNTVMIAVEYTNTGSPTVSVSGLGATWTKLFEQDMSFGHGSEVWKGTGVTGGSAAITLTASASTNWAANAAEFSGVNYIGTLNGGLASALTATTASQSLVSGDIAYGQFTWDNSAQSATYTDSPAAWTSLTVATQSSQGARVQPGYRLATGSESATRQATFSSGVTNIAYASIALAAAAPSTARPRRPFIVGRQALVRASVR